MSETQKPDPDTVHLPVLGQSGGSGSDWKPRMDRLNPNCVFVQRAGAPIYDSCTYCDKELRDCMRFRGQWLTGAAIAIIVMMVLIPMGDVAKYVVGGSLVALLGVYFRYVSQQSHNSIVNAYRIKEQRSRLASSERMAALGQISAVVMHEINNPLTYVQANVETLSESLSDIAKVSASEVPKEEREEIIQEMGEMLEDMRSGVQKVRMIAGDLRTVSRRGEDEKIFNLEASVRAALRVAGARVQEEAKIQLHGPGGELEIWGREDRLQQVVLNLVVNAAQACAEHQDANGDYMPAVTIRLRHDENSNTAVVEVSDNGPGIPVELHSKIFEPFFTTKSSEEGTGLGLSICRQIVEEFGGELVLNSSSSEGTVFEVRLPLGQDAIESAVSKNSMRSSQSMRSPSRPHV
jgi:signal transduction histidine kinase